MKLLKSIISTTVLLFLFNIGHAQKLLVVGEEFAPFEFKNDEGEVVGIDADIAKAIFDKLGIEYEMKLYPWARAWSMVKEGKADAVFSTSRKAEREPYLYYPTEDMWVSEYVFFVAAKNKEANFSSMENAKGKRVGVIRGASYNDAYWDAKLENVEAIDIETNLKKLQSGRIDLTPIDKIIGLFTSKKLEIQDEIDFYDFVLFSKGYPMPFVKNSSYPNIKEVSEQFEKELILMKQNGEYAKIRKKWLGR